jgi:hypothetical protein
MSCVQPASAPYAKLHIWQSGATISAAALAAATAASPALAMDKFQILPDNFFVLMAYVASTNYDNGPLEFTADNVNSGNPALYGPARLPSNFSVEIWQDNKDRMMGAPMPQACIASNGYLAGQQLPFPPMYKPLTTFQFKFYATPQVIQYDNADSPVPLDLEISFGFYGYNVPVEHVKLFCASWPSYQAAALSQVPLWLRNFTNMEIDGAT